MRRGAIILTEPTTRRTRSRKGLTIADLRFVIVAVTRVATRPIRQVRAQLRRPLRRRPMLSVAAPPSAAAFRHLESSHSKTDAQWRISAAPHDRFRPTARPRIHPHARTPYIGIMIYDLWFMNYDVPILVIIRAKIDVLLLDQQYDSILTFVYSHHYGVQQVHVGRHEPMSRIYKYIPIIFAIFRSRKRVFGGILPARHDGSQTAPASI